MTAMSFPGQMRHSRRRGALLVEAALAVGIAASLVTLTFSITQEQQRRTDAALIASEKRAIIVASHGFVRDNRADIILDLFDAGQATGSATRVFTIPDLVAAGYLAEDLNPGGAIDRLFGQEYALMARAVFQDDTARPPATLSVADMDPFGTGAIDPRYIDGDTANGEISIESILFTIGGNDIPINTRSRVIEQTGMLNAGSVVNEGVASGALGAMQFAISGFSTVTEYAQAGPGRFASPISVGPQGLVGDSTQSDLRDAFLRCTGLIPGTSIYEQCATADSNQVYTDIRFENFDSNNDGTIDVFPSIDGLTRLRCANPEGDLTDPVDPDAFLIDCETTRLSGNLEIDGDSISLGGEVLADIREIGGEDQTVVSAERIALRIPDGAGGSFERDLSEFVSATRTMTARQTVPVQSCPAVSLDGNFTMTPRAVAHVTAINDPWGRPISGVFARMERGNGNNASWTPDPNGSNWMARIFYAVAEDFCESDYGWPIQTNAIFNNGFDSVGRPTVCQSGARAGPSGSPDIYELRPNSGNDFGAVSVSFRCF